MKSQLDERDKMRLKILRETTERTIPILQEMQAVLDPGCIHFRELCDLAALQGSVLDKIDGIAQ